MIQDAPADTIQSPLEAGQLPDLADDEGLIGAAWREEFGRELTWTELVHWLGEAG